MEKVPSIGIFLNKIGHYILNSKYDLYRVNHYIILIPKIVVFYYQVFTYFYKASALLLIPLLFNNLTFSIREYYMEDIREFDAVVLIINNNTQESITGEAYLTKYYKTALFDFTAYTYKFTQVFLEKLQTESKVDYGNTLTSFMAQFNRSVQIMKISSVIKIKQIVSEPKYHAILYLVYVIGWGFVLYLIF